MFKSVEQNHLTAPTFYTNLESLRGLAALSVVVMHCLGVFPQATRVTGSFSIVVRCFLDAINGRNVVVLFFVLSGFVLSESLRCNDLSWRLFCAFMIKRLFRLLPIAYVVLALGTLYLLVATPSPDVLRQSPILLSDDFQHKTGFDIFLNFLFLRNNINDVYWTLFIELLASILFIPLLYITRLSGWFLQAIIQMSLLFMCYHYYGHAPFVWFGVPIPLPNLLIFFFCFHLGIVINRLRTSTTERHLTENQNNFWPKVPEIITVIVGLTLLLYAHSKISEYLQSLTIFMPGKGYKLSPLEIALEGFGASLVIYSCSGNQIKLTTWVLGSSLLRYLGKLSYGIYAIHLVILKPVYVVIAERLGPSLHDFPLRGPLLATLIVIPTSIVVAHLLNHYIEAPAIRLSRTIVQRKINAV